MKLRRNFVVELKSSRRQTKPQNRSIWGDTDLKALASEVEAKLPVSHLGRGKSLTPEKRSAKQIFGNAGGDARPPNETLTSEKLPETPPAPRILQALPQKPVEPEADPAPKETDCSPAPRVCSSKSSSDEKQKGLSPRIAIQSQVPGPDELEALEAENQRLKVMLRSQLQTENLELRKMLARLP